MNPKEAEEIVGDVIDAFFKIRSLSAVLEVDCCEEGDELIERWNKASSSSAVSNIARIIQEISEDQYDPLWDLEHMLSDMAKVRQS